MCGRGRIVDRERVKRLLMQKLTKRLKEKKNMNELDGGGGLNDKIWRGMYVCACICDAKIHIKGLIGQGTDP